MENNKNKTMHYGQTNDLNLKMVIALLRTNQAMSRRITKLLKENGMTLPQFGVLEVLYHKGELRIGEIIDKVLSTPGNMTVIIKNLEKEKMIESYSDLQDKRYTVVKITEKGKEQIEKVFPTHLLDLEEYFSVLTKEDKDGLIAILKKLGTR